MDINLAEGVDQTSMSVAQSNDSGQLVVLDSTAEHDGSMIIRTNTAEGQSIREAVKRATGTPIRRVKNTYYMRMWMDNLIDAGKTMTKGFTRPAK